MSQSRNSIRARSVSSSTDQVAERTEATERNAAEANGYTVRVNDNAVLSTSQSAAPANSNSVTPTVTENLIRVEPVQSQPGLSNLQQLVAVEHAAREGQSILFGRANARLQGGQSSFNTRGQTPAAPGLMVLSKCI